MDGADGFLKSSTLSRVALWIYGPLMIVDEVEPFTPPAGREPKDWQVDEFKKWLTICSLPINGTKEELKGQVLEYLSLPLEQQPKVIPPTYGTADGVMCMLRPMVVLLTTLMQPGVEGESHLDILELRTRLFLNAVEDFEKPLCKKRDELLQNKHDEKERKEVQKAKESKKKKLKTKKKQVTAKKEKPLWIEKYNFLSLLNLPKIVEHFGLVRTYFEGKYLGERFVQDVKNMRPRCPPKHVILNLLQKLHESKSIQAMAKAQSRNLQTLKSKQRVETEKIPKERKFWGMPKST
jgi:hypothetical protein